MGLRCLFAFSGKYNKWDTRPLVEEIIPIYWEKDGDRLRNPRPWTIYRPLNYIVVWSGLGVIVAE
jgi:hypothetical protein